MAHAGFHTPIGPLSVFSEGGKVIAVEWGWVEPSVMDPVIDEAKWQFELYFTGRLKRFDLPLGLPGTGFQRKVWSALLRIPYGETRSYGDVARSVNSAPRAVGRACGLNPIPIVVPCHRVIGNGGSLGGYSGGAGPETKRSLLDLENARHLGS